MCQQDNAVGEKKELSLKRIVGNEDLFTWDI